MTTTQPDGFKILHGWRTDGRAYDPSTTVITFSYKGEIFEATNRLGPGWPMVVRTAAEDRTFWCASAGWENWPEVTGHINARR
jgi:hypothetical protein